MARAGKGEQTWEIAGKPARARLFKKQQRKVETSEGEKIPTQGWKMSEADSLKEEEAKQKRLEDRAKKEKEEKEAEKATASAAAALASKTAANAAAAISARTPKGEAEEANLPHNKIANFKSAIAY